MTHTAHTSQHANKINLAYTREDPGQGRILRLYACLEGERTDTGVYAVRQRWYRKCEIGASITDRKGDRWNVLDVRSLVGFDVPDSY